MLWPQNMFLCRTKCSEGLFVTWDDTLQNVNTSTIEILYKGCAAEENGCCDGRVVKALDLKSNGIFPRRFEPCSQRNGFCTAIPCNWITTACRCKVPLSAAGVVHCKIIPIKDSIQQGLPSSVPHSFKASSISAWGERFSPGTSWSYKTHSHLSYERPCVVWKCFFLNVVRCSIWPDIHSKTHLLCFRPGSNRGPFAC